MKTLSNVLLSYSLAIVMKILAKYFTPKFLRRIIGAPTKP